MNRIRGKNKRLKVATNIHEANIVLSVQTQFFNNVLKHIIHIIMMNTYLVDSLYVTCTVTDSNLCALDCLEGKILLMTNKSF